MKNLSLRLLLLALFTIVLGLLSRRYLPPAFSAVGDILWAVVLYFLVRSLLIRWDIFHVAMLTFVIAAAVECSHLLHSPLLEVFCRTLPGRLIFGRGFSVSDLGLYAIGIIVAAGVGAFVAPASPVIERTEMHVS